MRRLIGIFFTFMLFIMKLSLEFVRYEVEFIHSAYRTWKNGIFCRWSFCQMFEFIFLLNQIDKISLKLFYITSWCSKKNFKKSSLDWVTLISDTEIWQRKLAESFSQPLDWTVISNCNLTMLFWSVIHHSPLVCAV